eukprot:6584819-Heterocapsa_arctica.AAC.1
MAVVATSNALEQRQAQQVEQIHLAFAVPSCMTLGEGHHPLPASGHAACGLDAIMQAMIESAGEVADAVASRR